MRVRVYKNDKDGQSLFAFRLFLFMKHFRRFFDFFRLERVVVARCGASRVSLSTSWGTDSTSSSFSSSSACTSSSSSSSWAGTGTADRTSWVVWGSRTACPAVRRRPCRQTGRRQSDVDFLTLPPPALPSLDATPHQPSLHTQSQPHTTCTSRNTLQYNNSATDCRRRGREPRD